MAGRLLARLLVLTTGSLATHLVFDVTSFETRLGRTNYPTEKRPTPPAACFFLGGFLRVRHEDQKLV